MFKAKCSYQPIVIGEGAGGTVYHGDYSRMGRKKPAAVKVFNLASQQGKIAFLNEVTAIAGVKKLGSPKYFVKVYKTRRIAEKGEIAMKLYDKDLFEYAMQGGEFEHSMRPIIKKICMGVKRLHDNGIAHLDLKPENILMKGRIPFIADFGAMIKLDDGVVKIPAKYFRGTYAYATPEIRNGEMFDPFSADVYSLGVMIHTCMTRTFPYAAGTKILELNYARHVLSPELFHVLSDMLAQNPRQRLSIDEVLASPWFD